MYRITTLTYSFAIFETFSLWFRIPWNFLKPPWSLFKTMYDVAIGETFLISVIFFLVEQSLPLSSPCIRSSLELMELHSFENANRKIQVEILTTSNETVTVPSTLQVGHEQCWQFLYHSKVLFITILQECWECFFLNKTSSKYWNFDKIRQRFNNLKSTFVSVSSQNFLGQNWWYFEKTI